MKPFIIVLAVLTSLLGAYEVVKPHGLSPTEHKYQEILIPDSVPPPGSAGMCFPWSIAVLDRYGKLNPEPPTQLEWAIIERESRVDPKTGGTSFGNVIKYFEERDYSVFLAEINQPTDCQEYYYVAEKMNEGCLVTVIMMPKYANISGHIEAVLGIEKCEAITNSWGKKAEINTKFKYLHSNMTIYSEVTTEAAFLVACKNHGDFNLRSFAQSDSLK